MHELPYVPWCWMVFGSEGRLEQTLSTDQDNGLVFSAESPEAASLRAIFLPFARAVNEALDACGFPLCKGNVMASESRSLPVGGQWKEKFLGWLRGREPEAILGRPSTSICARFMATRRWSRTAGLAACAGLGIARLPAGDGRVRAQLAVTARLVVELPLRRQPGVFHTIDLKLHGVRPFVDAARIWALARGGSATNTAARLRAVGPLLHQKAEETRHSWGRCHRSSACASPIRLLPRSLLQPTGLIPIASTNSIVRSSRRSSARSGSWNV